MSSEVTVFSDSDSDWACFGDIRKNLYAGVVLCTGVAVLQGIGELMAQERNVSYKTEIVFQ